MHKRFQDKVAVVTGAAQGIGRRVAERLLEEGAQVVAVDRSELVFELAEHAGVLCLTADLEQAGDCQGVMRSAVERFGRLDILINNVGGTIWAKPFEHYETAQIEAEVRRSLFPTLWCCHAALPQMLAQGAGAIVNVSSIATRGVNRVPYGAAKGGVNALTACLASRLPSAAFGSTPPPPVAPRRPPGASRATVPSRVPRRKAGISRSSTRPCRAA
jgi:dihydroxycyclohexadiene carboxylate dehydrogenase